jgi:hypothetical protein
MNNVYSIADQQFDFGKDAQKKAASSSSSTGGFGGGGRDAGFMRDVNLY